MDTAYSRMFFDVCVCVCVTRAAYGKRIEAVCVFV